MNNKFDYLLDEIQKEKDELNRTHAFDSLFHYTSTKVLQIILANNTLRATHINFLNDPTEASFSFEIYNEIIKSYEGQIHPSVIELLQISKHQDLIKRIFVTSFSSLPNSLNLWNYYGKSDGYNISFDLNAFNDNLSKITFEKDTRHITYSYIFSPVIYDHQEQINILDRFVSKMITVATEIMEGVEHAAKNGQACPKTPHFDNILAKIWVNLIPFFYLCKKEPHESEKEFRLVIIPQDTSEIEQFTDKDGIICPYIDYKLGKIIPISNITIGPKIVDSIAKEGVERFLEKLDRKDIKISHSGIELRF